MTTVEIDYELTYVACELADKRVENAPRLRMYYDTNLIRTEAEGGIVTLALDEDHLEKVYAGKLKARSNPQLGNKIPATTCIGFAQYAQRRNEYGMSCYTNAGTTHVKLYEIMDAVDAGKTFEQELPLQIENLRINGGEALEKGKINFKVKSIKLGPKISIIKKELCALSASYDQMETLLTTFISERMDDESLIPDTWGEQTANVRAPMDIEAAGIEMTKRCFLPVEAFAMGEPLVTNVGFFQNAMERQLARRGLNVKDDYPTFDLARKAELMAEICTYASQSFDYISDTVEGSNRMKDKVYNIRLKKGNEDFHDSGVTGSGDCEDGAHLIMVVSKAMIALDIDQKKNPELFELQQIAKQYDAYLTLATVHGAKAEDNTEHIGAHMYVLWLPKDYTKEALQFTDVGRLVASRIPLDVDSSMEKLPVLFGEGTGRIRPLGSGPGPTDHFKTAATSGLIESSHPMCYDPLVNARRYIGANMRSKGGLKTEIPHDRGADSPFYLGNLLVVTSSFIDLGYNVGAFTMCKVQDDGTITRGAMFTDIINRRANVALIPNRPIPTPVMKLMREAIAIRAPHMSFELNNPAPKNTNNPILDGMKKKIASLGRSGISPYGSVDIFMRPHQFNQQSIDIMTAELARLGAVYKVDYELESITDSLTQYRLMIFVDENKI